MQTGKSKLSQKLQEIKELTGGAGTWASTENQISDYIRRLDLIRDITNSIMEREKDKMNQKENALAAQMLKMASESYSNHGCNDWDWPEDWGIKERQDFTKAYHEWNGNPEEFDPKFLSLPDFAVMAFLAAKLKGELKDEINP